MHYPFACCLMTLAIASLHGLKAFPPKEGEFSQTRFGMPLYWCGQIQLAASLTILLASQVIDILYLVLVGNVVLRRTPFAFGIPKPKVGPWRNVDRCDLRLHLQRSCRSTCGRLSLPGSRMSGHGPCLAHRYRRFGERRPDCVVWSHVTGSQSSWRCPGSAKDTACRRHTSAGNCAQHLCFAAEPGTLRANCPTKSQFPIYLRPRCRGWFVLVMTFVAIGKHRNGVSALQT